MEQFFNSKYLDARVVLVPSWGMVKARAHYLCYHVFTRRLKGKTELEEIQRISHNISVVIDSERTKPDTQLKPARAAFVAVCESLNIHWLVLERRALDNYLSDRAVKEYKGNNYRAFGPYDLLKGPHVWDKANNWRIAGIMTEEELDETDLGKFLKSL